MLNQINIHHEVYWLRPRLTAPLFIDKKKIYTVPASNFKKNKDGEVCVFIKEINRWLLTDFFHYDYFIYN